MFRPRRNRRGGGFTLRRAMARVEPPRCVARAGRSERGASRQLPSVPTKVRLLNRVPTLDLGCGDYSLHPSGRLIRAGRLIRVSGPDVALTPRKGRGAGYGCCAANRMRNPIQIAALHYGCVSQADSTALACSPRDIGRMRPAFAQGTKSLRGAKRTAYGWGAISAVRPEYWVDLGRSRLGSFTWGHSG